MLTGQAAVTGIASVAEIGIGKSIEKNSGDNVIHIFNMEEKDIPLKHSIEKRKAVADIKQPVAKKNRTLTSRLDSYLEQNSPEEKYLADIATSLKKLVKIQKKILIEEIKLKLKYENVELNLTFSSDED
jgi:adenylosuccinate synthase